MVEFQTSRFGALSVEQDRVISFPDGLLGFNGIKRFILMDYKDTPLKWLQAVDDPDVAFMVAEPSVVSGQYDVKVDESVRHKLKIEDAADAAVLVILRVEDGNVVANFNGPLIINSRLMLGVQAVSENKN